MQSKQDEQNTRAIKGKLYQLIKKCGQGNNRVFLSKFVGVVKNDQWRIFKRKTVSDANVLRLPCLICKDTKSNKTGVMYYLDNAKHKVCVKCDAGLAIK